MKSGESEHQQAFFVWCRAIESRYPMLKWIHAIPNGGQRKKSTAVMLKKEGVKAGILDVFLPYPAQGYHGLMIEFKYGKNKLTDNQREYADYLVKNGYKVVIAYSWLEAKDAIKIYLGMTNG